MTVPPPPVPASHRAPPPLPPGKAAESPYPASVNACWALGLVSLGMGALTGLPAVILGHWILHGPPHAEPLSPSARKRARAGLLMGYGGNALTVVLVVLIYILIGLWRNLGWL